VVPPEILSPLVDAFLDDNFPAVWGLDRALASVDELNELITLLAGQE
jgi:hypothetical protein